MLAADVARVSRSAGWDGLCRRVSDYNSYISKVVLGKMCGVVIRWTDCQGFKVVGGSAGE